MLKEKQKQGEEFYVVKRTPGVDINGSVIFTFDRTGETRVEGAAVPGGKSIDVDIDEDGKLYFLNNCIRLVARYHGDVIVIAGEGDGDLRRRRINR